MVSKHNPQPHQATPDEHPKPHQATPNKHSQPHQATPSECAVLLLLLVESKNKEREGKRGDLTRVRLSELTLKRLWGKQRLPEKFLREVEDWLFRAGWALFYSGTTFAAVKTTAVDGWARLTSKRLSARLPEVEKGEFPFNEHYHLLLQEKSSGGNEDRSADQE